MLFKTFRFKSFVPCSIKYLVQPFMCVLVLDKLHVTLGAYWNLVQNLLYYQNYIEKDEDKTKSS